MYENARLHGLAEDVDRLGCDAERCRPGQGLLPLDPTHSSSCTMSPVLSHLFRGQPRDFARPSTKQVGPQEFVKQPRALERNAKAAEDSPTAATNQDSVLSQCRTSNRTGAAHGPIMRLRT